VGAGRRKARAREEYKDRLSGNLTDMRDRRNMTQGELADKAGVAIYTIVQAENGRTKPHPSTIRKLAAALNCDVEDLTGD
jgi:DNA-binding XRE family transcriptional regulator